MITFVLTSCGRQDLLEKTLDSFLKYNTYPIIEYLIIEDSGIYGCNDHLEKKYENLPFKWLYNVERKGMIASIDYVYNFVETEWVFHCEDDWEFYREGFIEKSLDILEHHHDILQVWLREIDDTNGHPISKDMYETWKGTNYYLVEKNYQGVWNGYSTNPGLRRLKDKVCFNAIDRLGPSNLGPESKISMYYEYAGFCAAILPEGYIKHIGDGRTAHL